MRSAPRCSSSGLNETRLSFWLMRRGSLDASYGNWQLCRITCPFVTVAFAL